MDDASKILGWGWEFLRWSGTHYAKQAGLEVMETHLALPPECGVIVEYRHAWPLLVDSGNCQFSGGAFRVVHRSAGIPGAHKPSGRLLTRSSYNSG